MVASRPGLTAVMGQLGGWSTGEIGKVMQEYSVVSSSQTVPAIPAAAGAEPAEARKSEKTPVDVFVLTPTDKDLAKSVKQITLAIDRPAPGGGGGHHLRFIEILTQQNDATRYWFYDVKDNAKLPADILTPTAGDPAASAPAGGKP